MKRIKRNPGKFEVIDLFTALGREHGFKVSEDADARQFMGLVKSSLKDSFEDAKLLHGKRIESLFAHVAGALGGCKLIKQEDSGVIFTNDENLQPPDYFLVLKTGERIFIEVKNCHFPNFKSPYSIQNDYIQRLENYAELTGASLKFAIFFSRYNKWVLLSKSSFKAYKTKHSINFIEAMARNEMSIIGDRMIGTIPPLSVVFVANPEKEAFITEDDQARFTVSELKFYCAEKEITANTEKKIAFYLIQFGKWAESEGEPLYDGERLAGVRLNYQPEHEEDMVNARQQGFGIVDHLSSMVSTAYKQHTVYDQRVIALDAAADPEIFTIEIPEGYKGDNLPLWQIELKPNTDFSMAK
ncbi:hypothetical protein [Pseudomonas sp. Irchel 3A5]|uniref:hypothetical protein n=1 Tax=Pseudomonas sp. Irchel 3A5 TaxID=2008911 RepID=UPI000BA4CEC6|nr:hypothetical protein [Pseudomonas sp. Irchel 3A5]